METRAQAVRNFLRKIDFPVEVSIGDASIRLSRPRYAQGEVRFMAEVRLNGVVIDRDEHVIVNPPTLIADDNGEVQRVFTHRDGSETVKRFRFDPLAVAAHVVLEAAMLKAQK